MSVSTATKNTMLGAITPDAMSAHSAFPGNTGASELSGGGYARSACTFNAASGAVRTLTAVTNVTIGTGQTVRWLGLWQSGSWLGYSPNSGNPKEFIVSPATDIVTCPSHGYADTNTIVFYGGTTPAGLTEGTIYFVRDATTDTFKVAATSGGVAIDMTALGAADCVLSIIAQDLYAGGGSHTVSSWSLGIVF